MQLADVGPVVDPSVVDDGDSFFFLSSSPQSFNDGLNVDSDGRGPHDKEGHHGHLVVGGFVVIAGGVEDGDQVLLQVHFKRA